MVPRLFENVVGRVADLDAPAIRLSKAADECGDA
jgi:hypothetical protein